MTKRFDPDAALDRAVEVFWSRGYAGTTAQDLVDGMGINRASMYATYGSKLDLYRLALARYKERALDRSRRAADGCTSARAAVEAVLRDYAAGLSDPGGGGRGCMLVGAAAEARVVDPHVVADVADGLSALRDEFAELLRRSPATELAMAPDAAAELLRAAVLGMRVLGTGGNDARALAAVVDAVVEAVFA